MTSWCEEPNFTAATRLACKEIYQRGMDKANRRFRRYNATQLLDCLGRWSAIMVSQQVVNGSAGQRVSEKEYYAKDSSEINDEIFIVPCPREI
jgi:hypothetical protein